MVECQDCLDDPLQSVPIGIGLLIGDKWTAERLVEHHRGSAAVLR
jgi:hypothetical protein